jgi:hypothetical protein
VVRERATSFQLIWSSRTHCPDSLYDVIMEHRKSKKEKNQVGGARILLSLQRKHETVREKREAHQHGVDNLAPGVIATPPCRNWPLFDVSIRSLCGPFL